MRYILDANSIITLLSGDNHLLGGRVSECAEGEIVISAIAFAEVAFGSWHGRRPSIIVLDAVVRAFPVIPFDHQAAKQYAQLPFRRGSFDRLIAAHALALGVVLITNNESDFADIPGLRVENWTR